jgi:hypothetical protein
MWVTITRAFLVGKPKGNRPLRRHKHRWEDNIRIDLRETDGSGYRQVADYCEHGNEPSDSIKGREFLDSMSDYLLPKKGSAPWS